MGIKKKEQKVKLNSSYIKAALSNYYRFSNSCKIMATEAGRYNSDFLVIKNNILCEIEIKISRADLNADFKKDKHRIYEASNSYWTPNEFYFAVPENLLDYAISKCVDKKYGVMVIREGGGVVQTKYYSHSHDKAVERSKYLMKRYSEFTTIGIKEDAGGFYALMSREQYIPWKKRVRIVKRAKKIHNRPPDKRVVDTIVARLSSEMANLRVSEYHLKESNNKEK